MIQTSKEAWRQQAACRGLDQHYWYGEIQGVGHIKPAKAICDRCPVKTECLNYAIENKEDYGIWGGLTSRERTNYLRRLRYRKRLDK